MLRHPETLEPVSFRLVGLRQSCILCPPLSNDPRIVAHLAIGDPMSIGKLALCVERPREGEQSVFNLTQSRLDLSP
jgi:hypothetical protein